MSGLSYALETLYYSACRLLTNEFSYLSTAGVTEVVGSQEAVWTGKSFHVTNTFSPPFENEP